MHSPPLPAAVSCALLLCLASGCGEPGAPISTDYALPPGIEWVQPARNTVLSAGQSVELEARLGDRDSDMESLQVEFWAGGRAVCEGIRPTASGAVLCLAALREGESELLATVTDPDGRQDSVETTVRVVPGLPPVLSFQAEHDEGPYLASEGVRVVIQATDSEDAPTDLEISLQSDMDGRLPLGPPDEAGRIFADLTLSPANHRLVLDVVDTAGQRTTGEIWVDVRASSSPSCIQLSPTSDTVVVAGAELRLEGRVDLLADLDRPVVSWDSDLDGRLAVAVVDGVGEASMTIGGLRQGTHELTFEAGAPASCAASVTIIAGAPPSLTLDTITSVRAGDSFDLIGHASDGEDAADELEIEVLDSSGILLGTTRPDLYGDFAVDLLMAEAGAALLTVAATDTHGMRTEHLLPLDILAE